MTAPPRELGSPKASRTVDRRVELVGIDGAARVRAVMRAAFAEYAACALPSSALDETEEVVARAIERGGALVVTDGAGDCAAVRFGLTWADAPSTDACWARVREAWDRRSEPSALSRVPQGALSFSRLSVVPRARGGGLGRLLVETLEGFAVRLGLATVTLTARSRMPDNRPYYEALGYRVTGYAPCYGIDDLVTSMEKPLARHG